MIKTTISLVCLLLLLLSVGIDQDLFGQQKSRIVEDDRDAGKLFIGNSCGLCESTVWTLEKKNLD